MVWVIGCHEKWLHEDQRCGGKTPIHRALGGEILLFFVLSVGDGMGFVPSSRLNGRKPTKSIPNIPWLPGIFTCIYHILSFISWNLQKTCLYNNYHNHHLLILVQWLQFFFHAQKNPNLYPIGSIYGRFTFTLGFQPQLESNGPMGVNITTIAEP